MEILIGLISSGVTEIIKWLTPKFGAELTKRAVHGVVFIVVLIGTYTVTTGMVSWEAIMNYVQIFSVAYANYNLLVKPLKKKLSK